MNSQSIEFLSLLGYLYLKSGHTERAVTILEAVVAIHPTDGRVFRTLAFSYLKAGRFSDCLQMCEEHAERADQAWQLLRGRALWGLGRQEEARNCVASITGALRGFDER